METKDKLKMTPEMILKCREGFPDEAYKAIDSKSFLTTLKAMYVTERLNAVFGVGRWSILVETIERTADYILLQGEFVSLDYDVIVPKQFGGHKTTGTGTEIADGYKSALTDCQSKIASYFEIGIDMFKGKIKCGGSGSNNDSKYKFGSPKEDALPWVSDDQVKAMIKVLPVQKATVITSLLKYKWSKKNKEIITKELDNVK